MSAFLLLITLVNQSTGVVNLPPGNIDVHTEIRIPDGAHDLEIRGARTTLRAADDFQGRAILSCRGCKNVSITGVTIQGNRAKLARPMGLPPYDKTFAEFYDNNGILFETSDGVTLTQVTLRNVANLAVLLNASKNITLDRVRVEQSGSMNGKRRNNTTGGILLESGTSDFVVKNCTITDVSGNGIWTHSLYKSPRNARGIITGNTFRNIGRDAVQVGHATAVTVERNTGDHIGFPFDVVDVEGGGIPAAIDTAGNVDNSHYANNKFEEINGKCIDLDGFHDGTVQSNTCINRGKPEDYPVGNFGIAMNNTNPDMQSQNIRVVGNVIDGAKFGGIFVIGTGHTIANNRLINLNLAHCNETHAQFGCLYLAGEPDFLRSGIYLASKAERPAPARGLRIIDNEITGYGMDKHCFEAAPGVERGASYIARNICKP